MTPEQLAAVLAAMSAEFRDTVVAQMRETNAELITAALAILAVQNAGPTPPADPAAPQPTDPPTSATTPPDPAQPTEPSPTATTPPVQGDAVSAEEAAAQREREENERRIANMVKITATQPEHYDAAAVAVLQIEATAAGETPADFAAKLRTIQIQPNPIAPGDVSQNAYSVSNVLTAMAHRDGGMARHELEISNEIKAGVTMYPTNPAAVAVPLQHITGDAMTKALEEANTRVSITTGDGAAGNAVPQNMQRYLRADVPDPLRIEGLLGEVPNTAGNGNLVMVTVPKPAMVGEPEDAGYAKTGDTKATNIELTPHIQLQRTLISRLAGVQLSELLTFNFAVSMDRMYEVENEQIVIGSGTGNEVKGIYHYDDIGESGELANAAAVTGSVVQTAMDKSFMFRGNAMNKRIIANPAVRRVWQNTARPAAVGMLYENGGIDGTTVEETEYLAGSDGSKVARGVVGPLMDMYRKTWDNVVYVTQYYEAGNHYLEIERFWDAVIAHSALWYKFKDDA